MPKAIIEDHIKRQAVRMMQDGCPAAEVADKCGIKVETIYGNWKTWAKKIEDELPDIIKPFVKPAAVEPVVLTAEEIPEETPDENTPGGEVPGTEVTEVPKEEGKMEKKSAIDRAVALIREAERLLTGYLDGGEPVRWLRVEIDQANTVELSVKKDTDGQLAAKLEIRLTMEEAEE